MVSGTVMSFRISMIYQLFCANQLVLTETDLRIFKIHLDKLEVGNPTVEANIFQAKFVLWIFERV